MRKMLFVSAFALCSAFACELKAQTPPVPGSATLLLLSMLGCATGAKLYMNNKKKGE